MYDLGFSLCNKCGCQDIGFVSSNLAVINDKKQTTTTTLLETLNL